MLLQCPLNTDLVAWVVGAMIPLPMLPFTRHKDNELNGCLEFGCDQDTTSANSQVASKGLRLKLQHSIPTQHYSASVTFFDLPVRYFSRKKA